MKRKIFGLILFAALALTCAFTLPTQALADNEGDWVYDPNWEDDDTQVGLTFAPIDASGDSYMVESCGKATSGALVIPSTYNGKPVTTIGRSAFSDCDYLTSVTIPDSVTSIGDDAFWACCGLTEITIPDSVTSIGSWAFDSCYGLTSVTISKYVEVIGSEAFTFCGELTGIWVDEENPNYCSDSNGVLFNKDKTVLLTVPGATESITIPNSVTTIGRGAFGSCKRLTSVTVPENVISIGNSAFLLSNLSSVTILGNVAEIGNYTFSYCESLKEVTIPASVTSIGKAAFESCTALETVNYMGDETQFGTISVGEKNEQFLNANIVYNATVKDDNKLTFELNEDGKSYYVASCDSAVSGELIIPATYNGLPVTGIADFAFHLLENLTSVTIPDSITTIGYAAFAHCEKLTNLTIPASVTTMEMSAFSGCTGLTSLTISDGIPAIGSNAFSECTGLTSITIPDSVTSIGISAFSDCTSLTSVTIPAGVTHIGPSAFYGCTNLETVHYAGSESQFAEISNADGNELLRDAELVCQIVEEPLPEEDKKEPVKKKDKTDDDDDEDEDNGSNMTVIIVAIAAAVVAASAATVVTVVILKKKKQ